mgnify:CR=1 FL=1
MPTMMAHRQFPTNLADLQQEIEGWARDYGLKFWDTIFEILDYDELSQVAAYGGFPTRYPHWRFGMQYDELMKGYSYGLQKIYEMVINTVPAHAFLLEGNMLVDHKTVMAHVYGHVDFFKNNFFFSRTNPRMLDEMANHASRVRRLVDQLGIEEVENFLDVDTTNISVEACIDRIVEEFLA